MRIFFGRFFGRLFWPKDFDSWMRIGISMDFCGPPVCSTHDGIPTSEEEDLEWEYQDVDGEPCHHVIRPYRDTAHKLAIEANHSPSTWRDRWTR